MSKLKEQCKNAHDTKWESVEIPEWSTAGSPVVLWVRNMSHEMKMKWEASLAKRDKNGKVSPDLGKSQFAFVRLCTFEGIEGLPFFTAEDYEWVKGKSNAPIQRLFDVAVKLSGVESSDVDELLENLD